MHSGRFLEVLNSSSGERVAAHAFGDADSVGCRVTCSCELNLDSQQKLLVGYEDEATNLLCVFDITTGVLSRSIIIPQPVYQLLSAKIYNHEINNNTFLGDLY